MSRGEPGDSDPEGKERPVKVQSKHSGGLWRQAAALGVIALLAVAMAAPAAAGDNDRKMNRQISVYERYVDEMLVDSPNFLVKGRENAVGVYVEDYGLVVAFETSLVSRDYDRHLGGKWWKRIFDHDDERIIILDDGDVIIGDDDWDYDLDDEDLEEYKEERKSWRSRGLKRLERRYTRGKTEIIDVLIEEGTLLTFLADDDWLQISAKLEDSKFFRKSKLDRLRMRVKMADLRAYSDGDLDEKAIIEKIEVKES